MIDIIAYHVDPAGNHDACMQAFAQNGIYIFLDIDTFTTQIYQTDPMWNASMFSAFTKVIDAFAKYDNIAGFFMANEVLTPYKLILIFRQLRRPMGLLRHPMSRLLCVIRRPI